ncbi:MAG TPA: hypothetical protein VHA52_02860 [Candidatus Babeliaceae bacterium]|nr:hypothetical protein [Candidatus Babeliaceae bacterium]
MKSLKYLVGAFLALSIFECKVMGQISMVAQKLKFQAALSQKAYPEALQALKILPAVSFTSQEYAEYLTKITEILAQKIEEELKVNGSSASGYNWVDYLVAGGIPTLISAIFATRHGLRGGGLEIPATALLLAYLGGLLGSAMTAFDFVNWLKGKFGSGYLSNLQRDIVALDGIIRELTAKSLGDSSEVSMTEAQITSQEA